MRKTLAEEFSSIYVLNLRGNQRTAGEQSRKEGGKVFGGGSRATVAITILVRDPARTGPATIHYTDIGDYLTAEQKLAKVASAGDVTGLEPVAQIAPNAHGDWLNQRREDFDQFTSLVPGLFTSAGRGLESGRDPWVCNYSRSSLAENMQVSIDTYQADLAAGSPTTMDEHRISWTSTLRSSVERGVRSSFQEGALRRGAYRPFNLVTRYVDRVWIHRLGESGRAFPTPNTPNTAFVLTGISSHAPFSLLAVNAIPDLHLLDTGQVFPRWRYEPVNEEGALDVGLEGEVVDGYRRIDNITDEALKRFSVAHGEFTKDDLFFYVYGLLHSPEYRETYAADLKKMLPRIPLVEDPWPFVEAGRQLSELHLGYESMTPYPLDGLDAKPNAGEDPYDFYRVQKMSFAKTRDPETKKLVADRSSVLYNSRITLTGIPESAYRYQLGSRSAVEWILDRYQVRTDKASGIVNDPNDWSREVGDPRYILDLLARIVTVSLETMAIVDGLPALVIREDQNPT